MISTACRLRREPGLSSIILGSVQLSDARREIGLGGNDTFHVVTTGALQENPAPVLAGDRIRAFLDLVDNDYDLIIFDSPPINVVTDAALLSSSCDAVLLVARSGVTPVPALALAVEQLRQVRAPIVGAVLNDIDFERDASYDGSYRYYGSTIPYETSATGQ
jgi:polysaccharide biosynthesis transport protein